MKNSAVIGEAQIPNGGVMQLVQGKDDFTIVLGGIGGELMSTRKHASEDALGYLPCRRLTDPNDNAHMLIGGLGMGFTLAAALAELGETARVTVAELVPEVVEWNRGPLGVRSGRPLDDPRTEILVVDVSLLLAENKNTYDIIALDIDNGPEGLTTPANTGLYSTEGIMKTLAALVPTGMMAYWSATADKPFYKRLRQCGLQVQEYPVHAHGNKGTRHYIYIATREKQG